MKFIREYAKEIGFDSYKEVEVHPNRIVCILTYFGKSPEKPSILLNSHYDVVPCDYVITLIISHMYLTLFVTAFIGLKKYWKCDPFEGKIYENGDICARGVQDMKSVGIL